MGLSGKLSAQVEIRSKADLFHEMLRYTPHHISSISPNRIQACDLHHGDWGAHGSTIQWKYIQDGKKKFVKEIVEIDEEKKRVTLKIVEGDILELYKTFTAHASIDIVGDTQMVTWEFEYEKINDDTEEPISLLQFVVGVTRDIEAHHLKN